MIFLKKIIITIYILALISILSLLCYFFYYSFHITKDVLVPNVIDNSLDEGIKKIKAQKLNYESIYVCGNGNKIFKTIPYENSMVKKNSTIYLYCEIENEEVLPNLAFYEIDKAKMVLEKFAKRYEILYVETEFYPENIIIKSEAYMDKIILYVSKEPYKNDSLNLIGLFDIEAIKILNDYNISFVLRYEESFLPSGMVIKTNAIGNSASKHNESQIILIIAK